MSIELGSFWSIKDSGCIAIVKSIIGKSDGCLTVVYVIISSEGVSSHRMSCDYKLFTKIADKFILESKLKESLNIEHVKGRTDGYSEGFQHGFALAKEEVIELAGKERSKVYGIGWNDGYQLAKRNNKN